MQLQPHWTSFSSSNTTFCCLRDSLLVLFSLNALQITVSFAIFRSQNLHNIQYYLLKKVFPDILLRGFRMSFIFFLCLVHSRCITFFPIWFCHWGCLTFGCFAVPPSVVQVQTWHPHLRQVPPIRSLSSHPIYNILIAVCILICDYLVNVFSLNRP